MSRAVSFLTLSSAAAATVTGRAVSQFVGVKVRAVWSPAAAPTSTLRAPPVPPAVTVASTVTVTGPVGSVARATVYTASAVSATVRARGVRVRPRVSGSVRVKASSAPAGDPG